MREMNPSKLAEVHSSARFFTIPAQFSHPASRNWAYDLIRRQYMQARRSLRVRWCDLGMHEVSSTEGEHKNNGGSSLLHQRKFLSQGGNWTPSETYLSPEPHRPYILPH
eukprot:EG_transcript_20300